MIYHKKGKAGSEGSRRGQEQEELSGEQEQCSEEEFNA